MTRVINGRTRLAGLVGWPLDHTLSPVMHNAAYEVLNLDWVYVPLAVKDGGCLTKVVGGLRALPFAGFNVTMPYKRLVMNLCDEVATQARLAGAVNTVHLSEGRLIGYNTDGRGLVESLAADAGFAPAGTRAVIVGAGGAAGAAVVALMMSKAAHVTVAARRVEEAEDLVDRICDHARETELEVSGLGPDLREAVESADLVVNATPLGMKADDPLPVPGEWLQRGQVVVDMLYRPAKTALLAAAASRGALPVGGLGMLVAQGAISIEIWNGDSNSSAPRDVMHAAAEAELARVEQSAAPTGRT
jgi:shikimate dehydrogenase